MREKKAKAMINVRWGNLNEEEQEKRVSQMIEGYEKQYSYMKE